MEMVSKIINRFKPYLILFLSCLIICVLLFYNGFPGGDDTNFHFASIYDLYDSIINNRSLYISGNLIQGLGYGKGLFYSPLAHINVVAINLLLTPFRVSLLSSYKLTLFLSIYISGIFMFNFARRISKNNIAISIIIGILYMVSPYRLFTFYARNAFSEAYALMYVPLFFMGLYDFTHIKDDSFNSKPFIEIIIGASLLYFSHNITALFSYFFGVIYILFYADKIYKNIKNKRYLIYSISSVILILCFTSIILLTSLKLYNQNIYNVSDPIKMWTTYDHVANEADRTWMYLGITKTEWVIAATNGLYSVETQVIEIILFVALAYGLFLLDYFLMKIKKLNKIHNHIACLIYISLVYILFKIFECVTDKIVIRDEFFYSACLLVIIYEVIFIFKNFYNKTKKLDIRSLIAYVFLISFCILFVTFGFLWHLMPSAFYVIQFCWRINGFFWLFFSLIMCLLLTKYIKQLSIFIVVLISILPLISQGSLEKRIKYESLNKNVLIENPINYPWKYEISKRYMYQPSSIGFNREYLPYIYYSIEEDNYLPKYNNSLYNKVRLQINSPSYNYYLKPTVLTGDAYIYDYLGVTPNKTFTIDVLSDDTTIQIPIFYYEGYTIKLNGVNVSLEDPKDMDYLLGFKVNKGKYNVQISYDCMKSTKVGHSLFNLALIGLCVFVLYDFWYQDKKKIYRAL